MKIFILKSKASISVVNAVYESKDFWLVPIYNSYGFDMYGKDVFELTIEEAEEVKNK